MKDLFGYEPLKSLSWRQPYASAMLAGKCETRTWDTDYRGKVLICTSQISYSEANCRSISGEEQFERMCKAINSREPALNTIDLDGYAIAVGELYHTARMRLIHEDLTFVKYRPECVLYCHFYRDVQLIVPFTWKGSLGLRDVSDSIRKKIVLL